MTTEQAAALRVILKFEVVAKTGSLLKDFVDETEMLAGALRNMELWNHLDFVLRYPFHKVVESANELYLTTPVVVKMNEGSYASFKSILGEGCYIQTLEVADRNPTMYTMIPIVMVARNIEALKAIFKLEEQSPQPFFFPMKMPANSKPS
jgi:hypothetical protein